ncbi:hypothetical protein GCM10022252_09660 [Streptosporangium oxazolinicum]|uniref:Uncharacterized protein n=1 Tax=Streptosporangium oxazolinicum TaxID=909287 RepID=A0ABP8AFB6_9ACTN
MSDRAEVTAQDLLTTAFPDWLIWRSDTGHWYATRRTRVTEAQGRTGCNRMVDAPTPADLSQKLVEQEQRAAKAAVTP